MKKKKSTGMKLELIGGIYVVEEFADGTEKREEIDGKTILELLLQIVTDHADRIIADEKAKRGKR